MNTNDTRRGALVAELINIKLIAGQCVQLNHDRDDVELTRQLGFLGMAVERVRFLQQELRDSA